MNLQQLSLLIFLLLITLLGLLAIWPTPGMITFVSALTGFLILLQVYIVLVDTNAESLPEEGYYQNK